MAEDHRWVTSSSHSTGAELCPIGPTCCLTSPQAQRALRAMRLPLDQGWSACRGNHRTCGQRRPRRNSSRVPRRCLSFAGVQPGTLFFSLRHGTTVTSQVARRFRVAGKGQSKEPACRSTHAYRGPHGSARVCEGSPGAKGQGWGRPLTLRTC